MKEFIQKAPVLKNQYEDDDLLKSFLAIKLPKKHQRIVSRDLADFGERVVSDIQEMARDAERNPPELVAFDPWGNRIDRVITSSGWENLARVSASEGLVSLGYTRDFGAYSRMVQFAKLYLFHPSSAFFSCPLAMTDGAAKLIEIYGTPELKQKAFAHLTSSDPDTFWTSGQWMTERTGGSDVSHTETVAEETKDGWRLYGTKWFCSAITAQMSMALARIKDKDGKTIPGSRGLSLFYIELKNENSENNNFEIIRIKEKLGTNALPTAEIILRGTKATLVGNVGDGVKNISSMFNITRLYNAITSVGAFRRILALAVDYSDKRSAFNKAIGQHPLNIAVLATAKIDYHACFHLTFLVSELLGNDEIYEKDNALELEHEDIKKLLRLLTPVAKLYTAKKVCRATSELLEVFAGVGYIEDSGIPRLYRDNQVFSIWEGTTNVLSLDLLRAMKKDYSFAVFVKFIQHKIKKIQSADLQHECTRLLASLDELMNSIENSILNADIELETKARDIAFSIGNIAAAACMLEHAANENAQGNAAEVVKMFLEKNPTQIEPFDQNRLDKWQRIIL
ncbi:MAG: acyl-CoA dehydrogenase family protein [Bacteriovorax sp.]